MKPRGVGGFLHSTLSYRDEVMFALEMARELELNPFERNEVFTFSFNCVLDFFLIVLRNA